MSANDINYKTLINVLSKMIDRDIVCADYKSEQLHGGTVGEVRLVTGIAKTSDSKKLPYKVVLKIQKKWNRQGDPNSWRREYDLYASDLHKYFTDEFRWPECYLAEIDEGETRLWLEYVDGVSGFSLTVDMLQKAAEEIGRFHGRINKNPQYIDKITYLSKFGGQKHYYFSYREKLIEYLRSEDCPIPKHLRNLMLDIDGNAENIFAKIEKFPAVLCHRDFWHENVFYANGKIRLIDWDSTGWGYMTEDIAQLVLNDAGGTNIDENYHALVPAYFKGLSEYIDTTRFEDLYIWELMIIKFTGYRLLYKYMAEESEEVKNQQIAVLQNIYDMYDGYKIWDAK